MEEKSLVVVEQPQNVQTESVLIIEQFLNDNYRLRRNMLSGKVEFKMRAEVTADYRPLTQEALNSIIIRALREGLDEDCNPKADITMYVNSEEVRLYNPVLAFLNDLPKWDGQNHVAKLFSRLPGLSSEQLAFLAVWLRATVAHWLQLDTLHGNEVVPVLIGSQGCGKTTFLRRLLPCQLREYYLDHLNLSNKFDNEEVARIQQLNLAYMQQKDIAEMVKVCFRKPKEGEKVKSLNTTEMLEIIRNDYPNVTITTKAKVELGRALVSLDYEHKSHSNVAYYKAVPLHVA